MNKKISRSLLLFFIFILKSAFGNESAALLTSTETDPDAIINHCVNVLNGDYCESATDITIQGPDLLVLQRFYNTKNYVTGDHAGGWRIFPQTILVIGKDRNKKSCAIRDDIFNWNYAFTGERSGGILTYSGWANTDGSTKDPLKINPLKDAIGMVNTYNIDINGQINHQNNELMVNQNRCELILGDGTKRIFKQVDHIPTILLGEELVPYLAERVLEPHYFRLFQETLPSGNHIIYEYDEDGHLSSIELKNASEEKSLSWMHLNYEFQSDTYIVTVETSDEKILQYHFSAHLISNNSNNFTLSKVTGSHTIPSTYDYQIKDNFCLLAKKNLPENQYIEIDYDSKNRVKTLKKPHPESEESIIFQSFEYGEGYSLRRDALGIKTKYLFDDRLQLYSIQQFDKHDLLYRMEKKYWGNKKSELGLLLAKTISDGAGRTLSYRSFQYDSNYNIVEERLYGNLTGKGEVSLNVSDDGELLNPDMEECHVKTFEYSKDGFNLLLKIGDCKKNKTVYQYKKGTNLLISKFIYDNENIKRRTFHYYNEDAVCIKVIADDGRTDEENISKSYSMTERHITSITPKQNLPGVGLPEEINEMVFDFNTKQEILEKKLVYHYDSQSNVLQVDTYDSKGDFAFSEKKSYNPIGLVTSEVDLLKREITYTYDDLGRKKTISVPHENKNIFIEYFSGNQPVSRIENIGEFQFYNFNKYDLLERKISSTDHNGHSTFYEYDEFSRVTKITHPGGSLQVIF